MYDHKQKQEKYVRQDTELANRSIIIQTMRDNMIIKAASIRWRCIKRSNDNIVDVRGMNTNKKPLLRIFIFGVLVFYFFLFFKSDV